MKIYRRHGCEAQHRTWKTFAKCAIRRTYRVTGEGEFALIAWCGVTTVSLHECEADALNGKLVIDGSACGSRCYRAHEIVRLVK